jgi:hypothetical protein
MDKELAEMGMEYHLTPLERAEVRERYPKVYFPDPILTPVWFGRREHQRIPGKKAIFDQTGFRTLENLEQPAIFGICSDQYKIVHYEDIVHMSEQSIGKLTDYGTIQICPHTYLEGARMRITVKFPDMKSEIRKVDSIFPKVDIFTSYDLSTKLKGQFGAYQLKCSNGVGVWKTFRQFAKKHLQNLFLNALGVNISEGLLIFGDQVNTWKSWAEKQISKDFYETIWEELPFSTAERVKIEALPEIGTGLLLSEAVKTNGLNLWSLNSVLTQWNTHNVTSEVRRIALEPVIAQVMGKLSEKAA